MLPLSAKIVLRYITSAEMKNAIELAQRNQMKQKKILQMGHLEHERVDGKKLFQIYESFLVKTEVEPLHQSNQM